MKGTEANKIKKQISGNRVIAIFWQDKGTNEAVAVNKDFISESEINIILETIETIIKAGVHIAVGDRIDDGTEVYYVNNIWHSLLGDDVLTEYEFE